MKVIFRHKDQSCCVELSPKTNGYLISSDVWRKTDWVFKQDHSLDTAVCVGYRKFAICKPNGQTLFLNRYNLQLCFAITTNKINGIQLFTFFVYTLLLS